MQSWLIAAACVAALASAPGSDAFSVGAGCAHRAATGPKLAVQPLSLRSPLLAPSLGARGGASAAAALGASSGLRSGSSRLSLAGGRPGGLRMQEAGAASPIEETEKKIPISLLSGFLGAGKTTLLKQVLENKGGLKVGVVVNDVAAVNIDSKLVKGSGGDQGTRMGIIGGQLLDASDVTELQNGCACCSASDELLESVMKLLVVAAQKNETYDRIVIEMSGVAEPKNVRKTFFEMRFNEHPVFTFAELQNMVTVIDSANFLPLYQTIEDLHERRDLVEEGEDQYSDRKVVDLLTEQVECADYVLLNKQDLVTREDEEKLRTIVGSLNPLAEIVSCSHGKADLDIVLGSNKKSWVANNDDEDDFRASLRAMTAKAPDAAACTDPECKDESHAHSHEKHAHSHEKHAHSHDEACADPECADESHAHSHETKAHAHSHETKVHAHTHDEACADEACTDASHAHAHSHDEACADEACTDPSHAHTHTHASKASNPEEKFGISSFVYSRRRPFDAARLKNVIRQMPVVANSEQASKGGDWEIPERGAGERDEASPMRRVIRSKGFVWLSNFHRVALYWSHAGRFMDLKEFGMYWAATPLDYWPRGNDMRQIVNDFGPKDYKWGDRRQEIVFIGVDMDRQKIEALLDECLATDDEMRAYEKDAEQQMEDRVVIDYSLEPPMPVDARSLVQK